MKHFTIKMIQQDNGLYKLQAFDNGIIVREEINLQYETAVQRIEQIQEEERNDAATP